MFPEIWSFDVYYRFASGRSFGVFASNEFRRTLENIYPAWWLYAFILLVGTSNHNQPVIYFLVAEEKSGWRGVPKKIGARKLCIVH